MLFPARKLLFLSLCTYEGSGRGVGEAEYAFSPGFNRHVSRPESFGELEVALLDGILQGCLLHALALTVWPPALTLRIFTNRPFGAAVAGALANTFPAASEVATALEVDIVIVEPSGETVRLLIPAESSTFVLLGMMVE